MYTFQQLGACLVQIAALKQSWAGCHSSRICSLSTGPHVCIGAILGEMCCVTQLHFNPEIFSVWRRRRMNTTEVAKQHEGFNALEHGSFTINEE